MAKRLRDPNSKIFHVATETVGQTLAGALKAWEKDLSWSNARKLVAARHVQINGNLCLDHGRRLKANEVVKLFTHPLAPPPSASDVEIVFVDPHLVIVNKPSGITSVRHRDEASSKSKDRKSQATLEDLMPQILEKTMGSLVAPPTTKTPKRNSTSRRPKKVLPHRKPRAKVFPVHRLDRDTSGLMIFALSTAVEKQLTGMFRDHTVNRTYRAVAHGNVRGMTIESELVRDRGDGLRGSVSEKTKDSQTAITHVRPVKGLGSYTLIECRLETGRTHQIRIHLSERGHQLCGDRMYCKTLDGKHKVDNSGAPRLALHAAKLDFLHPVTGRKIVVDAAMPDDLERFIKRLGATKKPSKPANTKHKKGGGDARK